MNSAHTLLSIKQLEIDYPSRDGHGRVTAVKGLNLDLEQGEIGCLLGSSGCGKSTVLRAICGFEPIKGGQILLRDKVVSSDSVHIPPSQRRVGMVFQEFALFPHLTVLDNIAFGLQHLTGPKRAAVALEWLKRVALSDKADAYPHELSGGQQQRVALARAMAPEPDLILLDEPFSSLDIELRERLAGETRDILKANNITALLVTHDQYEAFAIADKIGVMAEGKVIQWDIPYELYHQPVNRYVADFIGRGVFVKGLVQPNNKVLIELGELDLDAGHTGKVGEKIDVLLRADDISHDDHSPMQAEVVRKIFRGADFLYTLKLASGVEIFAFVPSHHDHAIGEKIGIHLVADHVVTFND
ncbi:ABC transporter ATP-binding protein [Polynucleobacter sp. es-EL-1]|jgi:iron(III) transport system ATP-binding protein|uniref:ABC transporter ATP-binding protein n=1 Tax=Polynucleobacter sp. es-EL-1 TaxID=1855652 RepID=UPI000BC5864F|nr:ABC transporter ATP-binding protein [Polynucleobacter sp. es-EL-1]OZA41224.1 MAG: ABC transporter ATP-binding protein [Polynucleobacter sp. 17-46-58]HQR83758.1 ABC transporter ATP-binding protein [Polynucleobacter sp.]QWE11062.1 ABC transporter ATP-binding protein [Polynucleobacter sp. es-EL-1]HQS61352.1 ABC transporter ATP-binding protein [Polynucleobacter sp.]HQT20082.1 ABC transporter ATP-binding protein [Polynucleobacter sp.]